MRLPRLVWITHVRNLWHHGTECTNTELTGSSLMPDKVAHQAGESVKLDRAIPTEVGISQAVPGENMIAVTGTAPLSPGGKTVAEGDAAAQARNCLKIIQAAIKD